jgi:hypothetical protein
VRRRSRAAARCPAQAVQWAHLAASVQLSAALYQANLAPCCCAAGGAGLPTVHQLGCRRAQGQGQGQGQGSDQGAASVLRRQLH